MGDQQRLQPPRGPVDARQRERAPARASSMIVQRKLAVGPVSDPAEAEADLVAGEVLRRLADRGPGTDADRDAVLAGDRSAPPVSRIRRSATSIGAAGGPVDADTERAISASRGNPLEPRVRRSMESAFGADFGDVRVHLGADSDALNDRLGARAFTAGSDIFVRREHYAPDTSAGQHLLAHELTHTLQQGGGDGAVSRLVRRQPVGELESDEAESAELAESAGGEQEAEEQESEELESDESDVVISVGTIGGPETFIAEEEGKEDGDRSAMSTPRSARTGARPAQRVEWVPEIGLSSSTRERSDAGGDHSDVVSVSRMQTKAATVGGKNVSAFGSESTAFRYENVTLRVRNGQIQLSGDMVGTFSWGTNDGGKIDVPSATAPVVTAANYQQIAADLTPELVQKSWRAPRSVYWSKAICERHEQYHAADDTQWFHARALAILRKYLRANPVDLTGVDPADKSAVLAEARPVLIDSIQALSSANMDFYKGGATSYYSYAGEERAFGDGKAPYEQLAAAVLARGPALERGARAKNWNAEWEQKISQARGNPVKPGTTS